MRCCSLRAHTFVAAVGFGTLAHQPIAATAAAPPRTKNDGLIVIGVYGCTCSGKSALCDELVKNESAEVIELDSFRWDEDQYTEKGVPQLDLSGLPWPSQKQPPAICKTFDTNTPEWMDWCKAEAAVDNAIKRAREAGLKYLVIEGFLIPSQPTIMAKLDHFVYLYVTPEASEVLMRRKYTRSHFGKKSYEQKGVSLQDFACFWDNYVFLRFQQHIPPQVPANTIIIDCLVPTAEAVATICAQLHEWQEC